jgi:hypothetical protein
MDAEEVMLKRLSPWKNSSRGSKYSIKVFNKNHDYHYQIQGQLHISNKNDCYLTVWTCKEKSLKVETIRRDNDF